MRRIFITLLLTLTCAYTAAQRLDSANYAYPIKGVAGLHAANFGEIRPGHFHAGIDIKTDGVEGKPLIAVADGYISRVVVTPGGYGRAIYLTLRDGKTAVYGHLQRFRPDIEKRVEEDRYRRRSNSADMWFGAAEWPVKRGDIIGYSGNSGSSFGAHLHFELRDAHTQRLINIVREGLCRPTDNLPPRIMHIHYIEVDTVRGVPVHSAPESYAVVREAGGRYRLTRSEPVGVGRKGYFVAEVTDRRNGVENTFGVWRVTASVDGTPYFEYRMDGFTHDFSRYCDAVSYYPIQLASRNEAIRLARLEGSPALFYPTMVDRGLIRTSEGQTRRIRIEAEDDCGNISHIEFDIAGRAETFRAEFDSAATILRPDRLSTLYINNELHVKIPAGALYEPIFARAERHPASCTADSVAVLSEAYRYLDASTPLFKAASVAIRIAVPERLQRHTTLATRTAKGTLSHVGGSYNDGVATASTRTMGDLVVVSDTIPPRIKPLCAEGANLSGSQTLGFRISDNFSGIASCTLLIDDEWAAADRFPVKGTLIHTFRTPPANRRHTAQLTVTDGCGNTAKYRITFFR